MNYAHHYKLRDYRFSRWLVTLRKKVGLTQEEVAGVVGVSEKAVRNWESGMSYPTPVNLKKLVEIYLHRGAFLPGQEQAEAKALWEQAYEHSARSNEYFDGDWSTAVYKQQSPDQPPSLPSPIQPLREDWGEAIDVSSFYGREQEIAELERWLLIDKCRLVVLLGMGGIGKTVLSVKFARQAASHFDFIFWRSLHNAPSLREILVDCVLLLSDQQYTDLPHDPEKLISMLVELLRQHHCLLILDNVETVLQGGNLAGRYREGYEGYEALFQRLAEVEHRSCLLLTSREMLQGLEHLKGLQAPVRVLKIASLDLSASRTMLKEKLLFGEEEIWLALVRRYGGNPLALKIVAEVVREVFGGDITAFLREEHVTFKSIRLFLDQQFERLSVLEQNMMYWLAIERDLVPLDTLSANFMHAVPRGELLEALTSLRWRSLLERGEQGAVFTLQPVVLEYVTERLTEHIGEEIISKKPALLLGFVLMKSQVKEYIQNSQVRLIVQPILDKLMTRFGSKQRIEQGLMDLADWLREQPFAEQGYGGGNMVNLLVSLNGNVRGQNFSHLVIRQAYLQGVEAQDADFVGSDLIGSVFTETFGGISSVALSRDGKYVATGGFNGQIRLWVLADGKLLLTQPGHIRMVWSLAFSPDGKLLASSGYDGHVKLWEVNSGQCLRVLDGHTNWAMSVAFSSDGHTLVTCGKDGSIRLWEVRDGTGLKMWSDKRGAIYSVAFSPNGLLASGSEDGEVRLWEIATGQCLQRITAHPGGGVFSIAFHHEGNIFASAGADGEVKVWEVNSGQCLKILRGHTKTVTSVVFGSADILASGSHDATVKLWEVSSGRCLTTLHGHNNMIWSID